jgi:NAD+ diphosphatase
MENRFIPSANGPPETSEKAQWFIFKGHSMFVMEEGGRVTVPCVRDPGELGLHILRQRYLGILDGLPCFCAEAAGDVNGLPGMALRGLRYLYGRLDDISHGVALRAIHMIEWDRTVRYCSQCGAETFDKTGMHAKECSRCGFISFPRISPAVIVLVEREGKALLARGTRFTEVIYSVLAGFVDPGESLEDTVRREIEEEVGIRVKDIRYFGSQPWPFPDSLMIGFTAQYESGEINVDKTEIVDAGWFEPDHLPEIPGPISIARKLIDWFVEKRLPSSKTGGPRMEKKYGVDE